jgi:hypothetical protein
MRLTTNNFWERISVPFHGDEFFVVLESALPFEEVEVATVRLLGILMAHTRTRIINRAAPKLGIEEHADAAEELVLLVAQDLLSLDGLGKAFLCRLLVHAEVPGQARQVAFLDHDPVVTTTIGRAFGTVVVDFGAVVR